MAKRGRKYYLINLDNKIYGGIIDPHTKAFTKTYKLNRTPVEEITNNSKLYHCYMTHNKVFGYQHHRTYRIEHFNFDNHKWWDMNSEVEFNIHNHTVKRLYWLQIPKKQQLIKKTNKDHYWTESMDGIPAILPNRTYNRISKNKHFSLKVKSIAHAYIYLEFYFGPQCLYMKDIQHLAHCQRCMPKAKCPCPHQTCRVINCKCACHRPTTHYNSPYHSIFCTALIPMIATILKLTKSTSIVLPIERHLLQWALITSDLAYLAKQTMKTLWYQIYIIYIQIMYRTHYNPLEHHLSYQSEFLSKFIHQLKVSHSKMLKDIKYNNASLKTEEIINENNKLIIQNFCRTWTHPHISTLDENNCLIINLNHKENEDHLYRECLTQATELVAYHFPYHTTNH